MSSKKIMMEQAYPVIKASLESGGSVTMTVNGKSMLPMLRDNVDTVTLQKPQGRLKKYDLPLYRRNDGSFVLHRVVGVNESGYIMCGDNQTAPEYGINDENIIGIVTEFTTRGKSYKSTYLPYRAYTVIRVNTRLFRRILKAFKRRMKSATGRVK